MAGRPADERCGREGWEKRGPTENRSSHGSRRIRHDDDDDDDDDDDSFGFSLLPLLTTSKSFL